MFPISHLHVSFCYILLQVSTALIFLIHLLFLAARTTDIKFSPQKEEKLPFAEYGVETCQRELLYALVVGLGKQTAYSTVPNWLGVKCWLYEDIASWFCYQLKGNRVYLCMVYVCVPVQYRYARYLAFFSLFFAPNCIFAFARIQNWSRMGCYLLWPQLRSKQQDY